MKAMRLHVPATLDNLYLDNDYDTAAPGPGEIKVRVRASSLNFRDYLVVNGFPAVAEGRIPLSDASGEVIAVGQGVSAFKVGDRVVSTFQTAWLSGDIDRSEMDGVLGGVVDGFACEVATRPATHFTHAPKDLSHAEAATLTCAGLTAWRAVITDGHVKPGATVMVQGTGGVSLFALQFAKAAGAVVIASSSTPEKLEKLKALGADHVINYRETPEWSTEVIALTGGLGVDHIVEVGGPNTLRQSMIAARTAGHIALIGAVGGWDNDAMPFAIAQAKRLRLQGVTVSSRRDQIDMIRAIDAHGIKPVIDSHFPLEKLADAMKHLHSGSHFGKICIDI